jgi:hypothetical protein
LDPRIFFAVGLACTAFAAMLNARYDSTWAAQNYYPTELLTGVGQAIATGRDTASGSEGP